MQTTQEFLKEIIESSGSKIFSVTFIKKDGSERTMSCHNRVTRDLKGEMAEERYRKAQKTRKENNPNLVNVVDVAVGVRNGGRRSINVDTIISLRVSGREYFVNEYGEVA